MLQCSDEIDSIRQRDSVEDSSRRARDGLNKYEEVVLAAAYATKGKK